MNEKLPVNLGDGLIMRWATPNDSEAIAEFNIRIHSDDSDNPQDWLGDWTRDLMTGKHPTTSASDFTLVVDENRNDRIVSSLNLISQTWTYDGIPFGVGRIELVGTDPEYRRRGLVRQQMDVMHQRSAGKGELIQAITGIPWYYRQFGYEMAVNLHGGRQFFWGRQKSDFFDKEEIYRIRIAAETDIPLLEELYSIHCGQNLLSCMRDYESWGYGLFTAQSDTPPALKAHIIEDKEGCVVAYADIRQWGTGFTVREMGVRKGSSWREAAFFLVRWLKIEADSLNKNREHPITNIYFSLGERHPIYEALDNLLDKQVKPYAWYIRVPEIHSFISHIVPILEQRIADSVLAGYSGNLRLNFYNNNLCFSFEYGRIGTIESYQPQMVEDADGLFPNLTFLQLLFGYRSLEELDYAFADCYARTDESAVLLNILFPRRPSNISPLE